MIFTLNKDSFMEAFPIFPVYVLNEFIKERLIKAGVTLSWTEGFGEPRWKCSRKPEDIPLLGIIFQKV